MKHLKYLRYVVRHKWYVFVECCRMGIPWRGITHDLSKFRPSEWFAYADYFYGPPRLSYKQVHGELRMRMEGHFQEDRKRAFDFAWLRHQKRNPHHWQYWLLPEDDGGTKILAMPRSYQEEMLADWRGAGKALGNPDSKAWYIQNRGRMQLCEGARWWVERQLGVSQEGAE